MAHRTSLMRTSLLVAAVLCPAACTSRESDNTRSGNGMPSPGQGTAHWPGSGLGTIASAPVACESSQIPMVFSPMYSAYDGVQLFQVPVTVAGFEPEAITWSISDPSIADMAIVPGGLMLTIQKADRATVVASAGSSCGSSTLTVTEAEPEDWEIGAARYNEGLVIDHIVRRRGDPAQPPREAACTSCHGETATAGPFRTVAHTPRQTAGFSDEELIKIFTEGALPEGAYFDETIVKKEIWQSFHRWTMSDEQKKAIVVYLRSLTPSEQTGSRGPFGGTMTGVMGGRDGHSDAGAGPDAHASSMR
jgi:hypothetical protein